MPASFRDKGRAGGESPAARGGAAPPAEALPPGWLWAPRPGDRLAPGASRRIAAAPPAAAALVADDLTEGPAGPALRLKPCFDPLLLERIDYAGRAVFFRAAALGPAARAALAAGDRRAALLATDPAAVAHLPWPAAILGPPGPDPAPPAPRAPLGPVAAVIPNRESPALLRAALAALRTEPERPAVVIVDNGSEGAEILALYAELAAGSDVVVERRPAPFNFAAMVNRGAEIARARFGPAALLLLNNDISAPTPGWLRPMAETLAAPRVGIVGAKLLFPEGTIQHAGVIVGHGGVAGHEGKGAAADWPGLCGRMAAPHLREAVTAAAMLVRAETWEALGGFDARAFPVAFNDVDFCLRAAALGWRTALDPRATLVHHEGASRRRPFRLGAFLARQAERTALRLRHGTLGRIDRFESPLRDPAFLGEQRLRNLRREPPIRF